MITLAQLKPGDRAKITGYQGGNPIYRRRLLAMGLTPGAVVTVVRRAPLGDPIQIELRNYCLSLRKVEASLLQLEIIE